MNERLKEKIMFMVYGLDYTDKTIINKEIKNILKKCTFSMRRNNSNQITFTLNKKSLDYKKRNIIFTVEDLDIFLQDEFIDVLCGNICNEPRYSPELNKKIEYILSLSTITFYFNHSFQCFYYDISLPLDKPTPMKFKQYWIDNNTNEKINPRTICGVVKNINKKSLNELFRIEKLLERESRETYYEELRYEKLWENYCEPKEQLTSILLNQLQNIANQKQEQSTKPEFETLEQDYEIKDKKSVNARDEKIHTTFKKNVNKIMTKCPITGLVIRTEYAHIKPYSISKKEGNYNECYDGFNGIILYNPIHQLFDDGMITFKNDGSLLISSKMSKEELSLFSCLQNGKIYNLGFLDERKAYLEYHREHIFKK